jgi:diaminopimelate epimerase
MDGGSVVIEWDEKTNTVLMTGPATTVYEGEISL